MKNGKISEDMLFTNKEGLRMVKEKSGGEWP
jgi:hypothetical protein